MKINVCICTPDGQTMEEREVPEDYFGAPAPVEEPTDTAALAAEVAELKAALAAMKGVTG
jgi:hypothetical protein